MSSYANVARGATVLPISDDAAIVTSSASGSVGVAPNEANNNNSTSIVDPAARFRFNLHFLKRVFQLFRVVFPNICSKNTALFAFLLLLSVLEQITAYNVGMISSQYYKALGDADVPLFWRVTLMSTALIVGIVAIKSTKNFVSGLLYLSLRRQVTNSLHLAYLHRKAFYMLHIYTDIDNPDQRIAQDVERMCRAFSGMADTLLVSPFIIAYYTYECVQITGWLGPGFSLAFFLLATIANRFLLQMVSRAIVRQEAGEGDFRHRHSQIRINAESAAFHDCEPVELEQCSASLETLLGLQRRVVLRQFALTAFVNFCDYAASIGSYLSLAVPIFSGVYDSLSRTDLASLISRTLFVMIYLFHQFTKLIDLAVEAGDIIGTSHRVLELGEALRECHWQCGPAGEGGTHEHQQQQHLETRIDGAGDQGTMTVIQPVLEIHGLCVKPPGSSERVLIKDLSLSLNAGDSLLITGPSGCGKTALLRTICGLWRPGGGCVGDRDRQIQLAPGSEMPGGRSPDRVLFAPQRPYFTPGGSLLQQVVFPRRLTAQLRSSLNFSWLESCLTKLGLDELLERCCGNSTGWDSVMDWPASLSPGEQQRLVALRCAYHRPALLLLDEATSALDPDLEAAVYQLLLDEVPELCLVSVGHRPSLREYHRKELALTLEPAVHKINDIK